MMLPVWERGFVRGLGVGMGVCLGVGSFAFPCISSHHSPQLPMAWLTELQ